MDVCTVWGPQSAARLALAMEPQQGARGAAAEEAAVGSPEARAAVSYPEGRETRLKPPSAAKHLAQVGRVHGGSPRAAPPLKATVGDELSGRPGARGHDGCSDMQWTSAR